MLALAVHLSLTTPVAALLRTADKLPQEKDVKAGWVAFAIFLALVAAVAFIGWSFSKQMKKVERAKQAGVFDDPNEQPATADDVRR